MQLTQKLEDRQEDEKNKTSIRERMRQRMKEKLASRNEGYPSSPEGDIISPLPLRSETPDGADMSPTRLSARQDGTYVIVIRFYQIVQDIFT